MKSTLLLLLSLGAGVLVADCVRADEFSPPAVPLVACDPYFSVWSPGDKLAEADTMHWTGKPHRLTSLVKIDGKVHRLMGARPDDVTALEQKALRVDPTQTIYEFAGSGVDIAVKFTTPAIPYDIDLLSRPITYITYAAQATDGKQHDVQFYFDASGELAVNVPDQEVQGSDESTDQMVALKVGHVSQSVLGHTGDDIRIEWGYLYVAANSSDVAARSLAQTRAVRGAFREGKQLPAVTEDRAAAGECAAALVLKPLKVGTEVSQQRLVLAYDDLYSIEFMEKPLRPYWRRNGLDAQGLLSEALAKADDTLVACDKFDEELLADLRAAGGDDYAQLASLCYRQCFAAGKFVADANGQPIQFCKENHSNGCIGTSDVFYPMAPQFLMFGPSVAKSFVAPFMEYAASPRWKFPFAPHDLGTYPKANGQVYGGGERTEDNQMPVEESGNLLILMAAIAQMEGDTAFADRYWPTLSKWAAYLEEKGFDPDNQLCTDDFAGHLAHNVNLSVKAICGLASYAKLCEMRGDAEQAARYQQVAKKFADQWVKSADDGDHFRLTFDGQGTWSQKYNMVWDKLLGLNLFPDEVRRKEMDYYIQVQNKFGLPLDNRSKYTKLDWILWTATLTGERSNFDALVKPVMTFVNETPNRQPLTDWYFTDSGEKRGFTARPVVGGVFLRMLYEDEVWQKWAKRDVTKAGDYAKLPIPPKRTTLVPTSAERASNWKYSLRQPGAQWMQAGFDDGTWSDGTGGFGTRQTPNSKVGTTWRTRHIWLRRTFDLPQHEGDLCLAAFYDEDMRVYINGELAAERQGFTTDYALVRLRPEAIATLKPTGNVLAVECRQTQGGQFIDVGLVSVEPDRE